jgi:tetratricopeptide (TPR) repeat protein
VDATDRKDEFLRTVAQIDAERTVARPIVQELRTSAALVWERELPQSWRTAGFAQELISVAIETLENDPRQSLVFAQLALTVTTSIPAGTYPAPLQAQLEGSAWKEIGTAHRYRSEYDAALRAYNAAQSCFCRESALAHDLAITDFARAIVLTDMGRQTDARRVLDDAVPVLRSFGDQRRVVQAVMLTGIIEQRQGRFEEARAAYESALREVAAADLQTRATLYLNLGQAQAELGETNEAMLNLHHARTLFVELKMSGEVTRTEWALACALLRTGAFDRAIPILEGTRVDFLARSMPEEAGLAGLDLVEALIATEKPAEARKITENVLAEFRAANLNERAITALAYLRDLPEAWQSDRAVRHVRTYIEQLRLEPARVFLPLSD